MAVDWFNPSHGILWLLKLGNFINQTNHEIDQYNDSINLTHQPLLGCYCLRLLHTEQGTAVMVRMDDAVMWEKGWTAPSGSVKNLSENLIH